jgi:hypothetical protein
VRSAMLAPVFEYGVLGLLWVAYLGWLIEALYR